MDRITLTIDNGYPWVFSMERGDTKFRLLNPPTQAEEDRVGWVKLGEDYTEIEYALKHLSTEEGYFEVVNASLPDSQ